MNYLETLLPLVEAKFELDDRKRRHRDDPALWAEEFLGVKLWSKQREIAYAVRDNHNVAVAAGHGGGKSWLASILMAWWADVHPISDVKILSTAPTFPQTNILWDSLRTWHSIAAERHKEHLRRIAIGAPLGEYQYNDHPLPGTITSMNVWKSDNGVRIGFGRKPPDNLLDSAFQGEHAPYLLAIGDEGAGLPAELVDALGNNASGSENRVLLIANPTNPTSRMADYWKKQSANWVRMNISVYDFPTITEEEGFDRAELEAKGMSGLGYIEDRKEDWGEDNPQFISRVLGEWAFESGMTVFTDADLAKAVDTVVIPDPDAKPRHGWDVARSGKDFTVGYRSVEGAVWETDEEGKPVRDTGRRGLQVRLIDHWGRAPLVGSDPANQSSAFRVNAHAINEACPFIAVDATGLGAGLVDGLRDLDFGRGKYQVFEYWASGASTDRRAYTNARAQHYFGLKDAMFRGAIDLDPADERLFDELRGIVYEYDDRGARKLESKDSVRRRGGKSPDFADAVIYASCDIAPITSNPLAHLSPGDKILVDPREIAFERRNRVGRPV